MILATGRNEDTVAPHLIQYWNTTTVPPYIAELIASFRDHNPDMRHTVFDERTAGELIAERFGERHLRAFRSCAVPAMQADYFRYCAVYVLGGIYVDADLGCLRPLDSLLEFPGQLFEHPNGPMVNSFFAFRSSRHPLLAMAIEIATTNIENRWTNNVGFATGPLIFTGLERLRRDGSPDLRREELPPQWRPLLEAAEKAIARHGPIDQAFRGVRISPRSSMTEWIQIPDQEKLLYKAEAEYWSNWEKPIFRAVRPTPRTSSVTPAEPMQIVQYWHEEPIPSEIVALTRSFEELNPEMRHTVFSAEDAEGLISTEFGERELAAFRSCAVPAMQADYFRYCAVLAFGGIYADADFLCVNPLDTMIGPNDEGILLGNPNGHIDNGFFVFTEARHLLLRLALDVATENIERRVSEKVNVVTGPWIFSSLRTLRDIGSLDLARERASGTPLEGLVDSLTAAVSEFDRLEEAFRGIRITPLETTGKWIAKPDVPPAYKRTEVHWANWGADGASIFIR